MGDVDDVDGGGGGRVVVVVVGVEAPVKIILKPGGEDEMYKNIAKRVKESPQELFVEATIVMEARDCDIFLSGRGMELRDLGIVYCDCQS